MNRCRESKLVQSWLDGDLAAGPASAFVAHMRSCPVCTAEVRGYRALYASLGDDLLVPDPGRALARPLMDPIVVAILFAAMLACVAMLRWMRPGSRPIEEEVRHVGLLF